MDLTEGIDLNDNEIDGGGGLNISALVQRQTLWGTCVPGGSGIQGSVAADSRGTSLPPRVHTHQHHLRGRQTERPEHRLRRQTLDLLVRQRTFRSGTR